MNIKRSVSLLLPAILILCACFSACGEPKSGFRTAAEKYLAFLGKTREEVLTGLKLAEGDLSPDSTDICAVLDSNEQFCGQKFSTQLFSTVPIRKPARQQTPRSWPLSNSSTVPGTRAAGVRTGQRGLCGNKGGIRRSRAFGGSGRQRTLSVPGKAGRAQGGPFGQPVRGQLGGYRPQGNGGRTVCRVDSKQHAFGPGGWQHLYPLPLVSLEAQAAVNKKLLPF